MSSRTSQSPNLDPTFDTPSTSQHHQFPYQIQQPYELLNSRPITAASVPPGFEGIVTASQSSRMDIRVALLEQELRHRHAQKTETDHKASLLTIEVERLTSLRHADAERVFVVVQELEHCERRTAKAEIGVEYLSERNVEIAAKLRNVEEPERRISALEEQVRRVNNDAEDRVSVLEMDIQGLNRDIEILKAKLENAMDTILTLSALPKAPPTTKATQVFGAASHHNNLIDLMDDSLTPTSYGSNGDHTTLLDESYDPEEEVWPPKAHVPQAISESFGSDYSNSSYIVRFKGIRDMTKPAENEDTPSFVSPSFVVICFNDDD